MDGVVRCKGKVVGVMKGKVSSVGLRACSLAHTVSRQLVLRNMHDDNINSDDCTYLTIHTTSSSTYFTYKVPYHTAALSFGTRSPIPDSETGPSMPRRPVRPLSFFARSNAALGLEV